MEILLKVYLKNMIMKIECIMQGVRDYIRFLKRGYGRTAHLCPLMLETIE